MSAAPLLTVLKDGETIRTLPVDSEAIVGRGENCVLRLDDRAISREHALFRRVGEAIQVEKRSQFAPLVVNGTECTTAVLKEGDVISIGPYLIRLTLQRESELKARQAGGPAAGEESPAEVIPLKPEVTEGSFPGSADTASGASPLSSGATQPVIESEPGDAAVSSGFEAVGMGAGKTTSVGMDGGFELPASGEAGALEFQDPLQSAGAAVAMPSELAGTASAGNSAGRTREVTVGILEAGLEFKPGDANFTEYRIAKEEISIGRGKDCDIILTDKRCSRRHSLIIREGSTFKIRDLGSSNGTFVNGSAITEHVLSGGDRIRIGDAEFVFKAVQAGYEEQARNLPSAAELAGEVSQSSPVDSFDLAAAIENGVREGDEHAPSEIVPESPISMESSASMPPPVPHAVPGAIASPHGIPGIPGIPGIGPSNPNRKETLIEKFKRQPKQRQILIVLLLILGAMWYLDDDQPPAPARKHKTAQVAAATGTTGGTGALAQGNQANLQSFNALTPEQKHFVEMQHDLAFNYYRNKQYDEALVEIEKIFSLVQDYKDSREIERYAKEGKRKLEALAEEKRKQDAEEELKRKVADALDRARELMANKKYREASDVFAQILSLDPENQEVTNMQRELAQIEEDEKVEAQKRAVQQEINRQGWMAAEQAARIKKEGKYHAAIHAFRQIEALGPTDVKLKRLIRLEIARCQAAIAAALGPLLSGAKQSEDSGDFVKAFELYEKAERLEPESRVVQEGTDRIRRILHDRAKSLYTEAVLAESYSDFSTARKKYTDCLRTAPGDDIYHDRAERKLSHFFDDGSEDNSTQ